MKWLDLLRHYDKRDPRRLAFGGGSAHGSQTIGLKVNSSKRSSSHVLTVSVTSSVSLIPGEKSLL